MTDKQAVDAVWFYEKEGKQCGGVTLEEMITLIQSKSLNELSQVWTKELSDWMPLRETVLSEYLDANVSQESVANDNLPPPLKANIEPKETPQLLGFGATLKDVWALVYAPSSASVLIYLLALYLGYNRQDSYEIWISPIFVAMSWGIVFVVWLYDWWKFRKTEGYTGWSWWWLIMPCYLHARVGKRLKYTFAMMGLSVLFSSLVSIVLTLHGTEYFDDGYTSYQSHSNNHPAAQQVPSLQAVANSLQLSMDMKLRSEYGKDYQFGENRVYVEQLGDYRFKAYNSWSCGSGGCDYTYYGYAGNGSICELNANNDAQAYAQTDCISEAFKVQ